MKLRDYPFEVVKFSCGKSLLNGRYKKTALIEKNTADIPLPDLRSHIAHDCQRTTKMGRTDPYSVLYLEVLRAPCVRKLEDLFNKYYRISQCTAKLY